MATTTASRPTSKPAFLGTLNAIALGESAAGVYLEAWANATTDDDLACTLRLVAARETSHGNLFCRRINELGFDLLQRPDPEASARVARYANPKVSDLDKAGPDRGEGGGNPFADIERQMEDGIYDPLTAKLMTWYIAEERDSGKLLSEAYSCVRQKAGGGSMNSATASTNGHSADATALMECMTAGFSRLEKALEKLAAKK